MSGAAPLLGDGVTPERPLGVSEGPSAREGDAERTGELRVEVARALDEAGVSPFEIEDFRIEDVADRLWRAGFRRVSEDDDTVERVARAMRADEVARFGTADDGARLAPWEECREFTQEKFRKQARAVLAALRGGAE